MMIFEGIKGVDGIVVWSFVAICVDPNATVVSPSFVSVLIPEGTIPSVVSTLLKVRWASG